MKSRHGLTKLLAPIALAIAVASCVTVAPAAAAISVKQANEFVPAVSPAALSLLQAAGLSAVITQVSGTATVVDPSGTPRSAQPYQVLPAGATLRVASGAHVGLVCSTEYFVSLDTVTQWVLTQAACERGQRLQPGSYARVAPQPVCAYRNGQCVLEQPTREKESDYGNTPVILSPRNTNLVELAPTVQWTEVPNALEYVLDLNGLGSFADITFKASELSCVKDERTAPYRLCTADWPEEWILALGKRYYLTVKARTGIASRLRSSQPSGLRTLDANTVATVQDEVAALEAMELDAVTTDLLKAGLYAGQEDYAQAVPLYTRVLAAQPAPVLYVTLGNAYRAIDLQRFAAGAYQQALDLVDEGEDDPAVRAAAEFGLGQVEYSRMNYVAAAPHFAKAVELYQKMNAGQELQAAQEALEEARQRLLNDPQVRAQALFDQGSALVGDGELQAALTEFEAALPFYRKTNDSSGQAHCLLEIGDVKAQLFDFEGALAAYEASLPIWREISDGKGEGRTLNNIGTVYHDLSRYEEALVKYEQALAIRQEVGDKEGEGSTLSNIGAVYYKLGRYEEALVKYEQALAIRQEVGDKEGEGSTLSNIGPVYYELGRYEEALANYEGALAIQQAIGDRGSEGTTLNNIGAVYYELGRYQEALATLEQALAIRQEVGDKEGEGSTLSNIGAVYYELGRYEEALANYEGALAIQQAIGDKEGEGSALHNIGGVYYELGRYEETLATLEHALAIQQAIGDRGSEGTTLNNIGSVYYKLGRYEESLANHEQALAIQQAIGGRGDEGWALNNIGRVYSELGRYEEALATLEQALAIHQAIGGRGGEAATLANIGSLHESQRNATQAILNYQQSITVTESIQGAMNVEELKSSFAGIQNENYERLINLLWAENQSEQAYAYSERARARAFLNQLGNQQVDVRHGDANTLIEQEQQLSQRITGLQNALRDERSKKVGQQNQELLGTLSSDLEAARQQRERLLIRLKVTNREYASLVSIDTLSLKQVQEQVLDAQTTLIEYFVSDASTLAWVIDHDDFEPVHLAISRDDLTGQVGAVRDSIATLNKYPDDAIAAADLRDSLLALHDSLIAPLKPHIRHNNLVIVPHGVLHYLPFAALWNEEDERYLIEDYTITFAPSASALRFILDKRNPDEGRLLALGNPDGSLPKAADEVRAVAHLFGRSPLIGEQATETQVYARARNIDLLHLAAHGVYDSYNPLYTRIELAADDENDGNLEVHEVFGLKLTGANLVVLSACETGLGEQSAGDELVGLTRAFLYAGAPAVVTTLWLVDDQAAAALMAAFYRQVRAGQSYAEALRAAQREMLAQEQWQMPHNWAAFGLTGDYRSEDAP